MGGHNDYCKLDFIKSLKSANGEGNGLVGWSDGFAAQRRSGFVWTKSLNTLAQTCTTHKVRSLHTSLMYAQFCRFNQIYVTQLTHRSPAWDTRDTLCGTCAVRAHSARALPRAARQHFCLLMILELEMNHREASEQTPETFNKQKTCTNIFVRKSDMQRKYFIRL